MCDAEPTHEVASIHIMPPEMRCMIMNFVGPSLRDLAAAYIASPLLFFVDLRSLIVPWGAVHTYRLIKAGAPLDVVQAVVRERKDPLYRRIIKAAAYGGRLDVLRYLLDHGEVAECHIQFDDGTRDRGRPPKSLTAREALLGAVRAAVKRGHADVVRHLVLRKPLGVDLCNLLKKDEGFAALAASRGHLAVLQMAHDRAPCVVRRRPCTPSKMGACAWESDDERIPRWLAEYGCSGYREPVVDDVAAMIRSGRAAMLRYALSFERLRAAVAAHAKIKSALGDAAKAGHRDTIIVAVEAGLHDRFYVMLKCAIDAERLDIVRWIGSLECERRVTADDVRVALVWSHFWQSAATCEVMAWLVEKFGVQVDAGTVYAAYRNWGPRAARALLPLMAADRARSIGWGSLMGHALTKSLDHVRYLVEEHGVRIEGRHFLDAGLPSHEVLDYVLDRFSLATLQEAVDMRGARISLDDAKFVRAVRDRVPAVCASVAVSAGPYCFNGEPRGQVLSCDCPKCSEHPAASPAPHPS